MSALKTLAASAILLATSALWVSCSNGDANKNERHDPEKARKVEIDSSSALTFIESNPNMSMWGVLLRTSKWAKEIHNGRFIILTPPNDKLQTMDVDLLSQLKQPAYKNILDRMIAKHIITTEFSVNKLEGVQELQCIDGSKVSVKAGSHQIGDVTFTGKEYPLANGLVVEMNSIVEFPEKEIYAIWKGEEKGKAQK